MLRNPHLFHTAGRQ